LKPVARRALQLWNTWTIRQYTSEVHIPGLVVTLIMKISFFLAIVLIFAASACAQQDATGSASPIDQAQKLIDANELQKASDLISTFLRRDPANEAATLKLGEIRPLELARWRPPNLRPSPTAMPAWMAARSCA
jgi:hypothetical protein